MEINEIRKKIDKLDEKIVALLNDRAQMSLAIGKEKAKNNKSVYAPDREKEVLDRIKALSHGPVTASALEAIYREIMSCSLSLEKPLSIAVLGQKGSYTYTAARQIFGLQVSYLGCSTIGEIFQKVEDGECDYGVVPIENSTEGAVTPTFDLLADSELKICRQFLREIRHNLLSNYPKEKIVKIYANAQALGQCRIWLSHNMPDVGHIFVASTTDAAQHASKEKNTASIGSLEVAEEYGLNVVAKNIYDTTHNTTRFFVIGRNDAAQTGKDRTSILFSIKDKVGALYKMLEPFYKEKINLTKIESRPSKKKAWDYYFFVDFEGHRLDPKVKRALDQLENMCKYLKVLGSYPVLE
ncbi:MAG: prephenate dehydratase [Candidatus Omnitrophica bacterium]|nr:prephenate dehydratase [Candidatus Omnitrophota bacterium]